MTNLALPRNFVARGFVASGLLLVLFALPTAVRAADPDIPRMQADAQRGSIRQQIELGAAYFSGRGVPQDEKLAAYWYERAANAGDPWAQKQMGFFYEAGIGVQRDPTQAVRWFERAAAGGLVSAKVNLGIAYLLGDGVQKDPALAEKLFHRAFEQGSGIAACYLGEMYTGGLGVVSDVAAGEHWYEEGAKRHDPRSQFQLATLLWQRQKSVEEPKRAVKLMRESANGGMVAAKHQLAVTLLKHPELGPVKDAPALLKEASEAGMWQSSMALGLVWRDGMAGVKADAKLSYYYYRLAAIQGGQQALQMINNELEALSDRLGAEQASAVDRDAQAWFAGHHLFHSFVDKDGGKHKEYPVYAAKARGPAVYSGPAIPLELSAGFMELPARGRLSAQ